VSELDSIRIKAAPDSKKERYSRYLAKKIEIKKA